jgi:hypothetical protein
MPGNGRAAAASRCQSRFKHGLLNAHDMRHSVEQQNRIYEELQILRTGEATDANLCQRGNVSCVRCCLPHIGGDAHIGDPGGSTAYLGPGNLPMKFNNFNPLKDPRIEASQYEDSFPDVGRDEMERRFRERKGLFLEIYDPKAPRQSLPRYMKAAQENEAYKYQPDVSAGPVSLFLGGSVSAKRLHSGELPECHLLGFVDGQGRVGCMAHPLAETSRGYDGRDQVGFFHHTGCCDAVGCEASKEFRFLSASALKVFDKAVDGMSWYEYSRHATSVLVYYLRGYDCILQELDGKGFLDGLSLEKLVAFTNALYDEWPMREPGRRHSPEILVTAIPLAERVLYIALGTRFLHGHWEAQLRHARESIEERIEMLGHTP